MSILGKIKLIAIAKDEAAYLPEWIFHHLFFGFDAIEIHINRTQDKTIEVLDKIKIQYPQVTYINADWIDLTSDRVSQFMELWQTMIYSEAYWRTKNNDNYEYVCFLDIDEFWTPLNLETSVQSFLTNFHKCSSISFNWWNVINEEVPFSFLPDTMDVLPNGHVKTFINLQSTISKMRVHLPDFSKDDKFHGNFLSDGSIFVPSPKFKQCIAPELVQIDRPVVILHRMYRSEQEYIGLLIRGRQSPKQRFKTNRSGYIRTSVNSKKLSFKTDAYQKYSSSRDSFFQSICIENEMKEAIETTKIHFRESVALLKRGVNSYTDDEVKSISKAFSGVKNDQIRIALQPFLKRNTSLFDRTIRLINSVTKRVTFK